MSVAFTPISDSELESMDLSTLQNYYNLVMKTVDAETSTINGNQAIQSQYDYLIINTQSTIDGLGYEILANSNLIIASDVRSNQIVRSNIELDSSIILYNSSIQGYSEIINQTDRELSSLMIEAADITSVLEKSDLEFNSTATNYSSLYMIFMAKDQLYENCLSNISTTSTLLEVAIKNERISYSNWQISTAFTVARSAELSTLYLDSNAIQSTLTQYITDETTAIANLNSTNNGLIAISSLYNTALVNQQYYRSLSTKSGVLDLLTAANITHTTAKAASDADPSNTTKLAAKTMSEQRVATLTTNKSQAEAQVAALQVLVTDATADTYATTLKAAEDAVELEINNINIFQGYYNSSLAAITYYSTLFEQATADITSSIEAVNKFSTFYISSIAGSNALMSLAATDETSIAQKRSEIDVLTLTIESQERVYSTNMSSYSGWISYSSLMGEQIRQADADLTAYSSFFESTNTVLRKYNIELDAVNASITSNTIEMRTQSSILESETINMRGFETLIALSFNKEEQATYQYRETYVRERRLLAQRYYDSCVLQQVQATSTQNGDLIKQAGSATVTPIAINLNTPTINLAYNNLTTVTTFLDSFDSIYANYDIQTQNLENISTSIGDQRTLLSTLTSHSDRYQIYSTDPTVGQSFSNAQTNFMSKQADTVRLQSNLALTQSQINTAKNTFLTTYQTVFLSSDIVNNESTISSFLIQGFKAAGVV